MKYQNRRNRYIPNTPIHNRSLSWLGAGT